MKARFDIPALLDIRKWEYDTYFHNLATRATVWRTKDDHEGVANHDYTINGTRPS